MKNRLAGVKLVFFALLCVLGVQGCKDPQVRPGASFDGSVKWALQIAQPDINTFAGDAQLYSILGAMIWKDGRLPANTGTWSFITWSAGLKKKYQVTVDYQGKITRSATDQEGPPKTPSGTTLPAGWVNSTNIFASIPAQQITSNCATLVVFNFTNFDQAPNTAVWGVNFNGSKNPLVRWDGRYIGTQF